MFVDLRQTEIAASEAIAHVSHAGAGAIDVFVGVVRDSNLGLCVTGLEYSAYEPMAKKELERIANEVERAHPGVRVAAIHRLGSLTVGDAAVVCAASAVHRDQAFAACRALIEGIKADVPIWKKEFGPDGAHWVGWVDARCSHGHGIAPMSSAAGKHP
jgi:molybdopterin synthase catalytic subunit